MPVSVGAPSLTRAINKQINSLEDTLRIVPIPRDHPRRTFPNGRPKERAKENGPFSFSFHCYQSLTFHHRVSRQSCYKPTSDTSNTLSTVWPTSREMKRTIIQNSHLLWVTSLSWKEGNNIIVWEKGHFSCSAGCLHHPRLHGLQVGSHRKASDGGKALWTYQLAETGAQASPTTVSLKPVCWPLRSGYQK